uniref:CASP-like protein n=1 Tax=Opuntia streptacantha TaxID=393608 RepID=A0A7C8ZIW1_OPUST
MGICSHGYSMEKVEALLRLLALCALALAAVLMSTDRQTTMFLGVIAKKATFHCAKIFVLSVYLYTIGAGYTLAQLVRCLYLNKLSHQMVVYVIFAVTCASMQIALFALTGEEDFQWMKLCNNYRRFCFQLGGSLVCGLLAFFFLVLISGISTFNLFRWYSPNFLCLKPKRIAVVANPNS